MTKKPDDHYHNSDDKHKQGNAVHAMHKLQVERLRVVMIPFADVEIRKNLVPDTLFHKGYYFYKVTKFISYNYYICSPHGELAHLARALAWHARGNRFDSGILHSTGRKAK